MDPRYGRADEPTAVLEAAIQELVQQQQAKAPQQQARAVEAPDFLPAAKFEGAKQGYYFSTGEHGTGYYRDPTQPLEDGAAAAKQRQDPEQLLREAEQQAEANEVQLLDERSLRKMLNAFEKKAKENLELRMKYADEPMKFIDNEVDLMSLIRGIAQVAADPNTLYPLLIDSPAVTTLAGLLSHDNTDIAMEVMDLLQELTDADEEEDNEEVAGMLVDALTDANALELLVERLSKLNESVDEEANAVNHALAVLEHTLELRPNMAEPLLERTKLLKWLLQRIRVRASDSNKQYVSEVLSILMQGHEANQKRLNEANGIDTLLVCLAGFKNRDPADAEEQEFMENLFDTLCSCLLLPANRAAFVECEGVELMHLLLKGKKSSRYGAIKTMDFATTRSPSACDRLVEAGALAQLFAIFMGRSKIKNSKGDKTDRDVAKEVEERCVSIISNLFQGVTKNSRKERLAAKFVEAEYEKVDRLMEICFRYESSVRACEARIARQAEEEDAEVDEEELLLERLDAGLHTLQCGMVIVAALWSTGDAGLRKRLLAVLHQRGQTLEMVRNYLKEFYYSLGDEGAPDEKQQQLHRLAQLLSAIGEDIAAEPAAKQASSVPEAAAANGADIQDVDMDEDMDLGADEQGRVQQAAAANPSQQRQQPPDGLEHQQLPGQNGMSGSGPAEVQQQRDRQQHEDLRVQQQPQQKQPEQEQHVGSRAKQRDRDKSSRDKGKERDRGGGRDHKDRERDKEGNRDRDKGKDRGKERDREYGGDRDRDRDTERSRRSSRSAERHRRRHRSRGRDDLEAAHKGSSTNSRHKRRRHSPSQSRSRSR